MANNTTNHFPNKIHNCLSFSMASTGQESSSPNQLKLPISRTTECATTWTTIQLASLDSLRHAWNIYKTFKSRISFLISSMTTPTALEQLANAFIVLTLDSIQAIRLHHHRPPSSLYTKLQTIHNQMVPVLTHSVYPLPIENLHSHYERPQIH